MKLYCIHSILFSYSHYSKKKAKVLVTKKGTTEAENKYPNVVEKTLRLKRVKKVTKTCRFFDTL